jgi:hypothetical protein
MSRQVVFDRLRHEDFYQFARRPPTKGTQSELLLAVDSMMLAISLRREVLVNRLRENSDLLGDKCKQPSGWLFASTQWAARIAQVAEHEGVAETIVIAAGAPDCCTIRFR